MYSDAETALLKACNSIKLANTIKPGTKLVPNLQTFGITVYASHAIARMFLEDFLVSHPRHSYRSHALALIASLDLMHEDRDSAKNYVKKLLRCLNPDKASLVLCSILQAEMNNENIDFKKIKQKQTMIIKKVEQDIKY